MSKGVGFVILVVGRKDAGKTTYTKTLVRTTGKKLRVFDYKGDWTGKRELDFDGFIETAKHLTDTFIVVEESTSFLSSDKRDKRIMDLVTGASHASNVITFLFHSWRSVPVYLLDFIDYRVCFKTNDDEGLIREKFRYFPDLIASFGEVRKNNYPHFHLVSRHMA